MSLLCSTDTLRGEADCIACDGYVTTGRRLEDAADEIDQLRAENAKLREIVRDFYPFASGRAAKPWLAVRRDRMRELGIEVDE